MNTSLPEIHFLTYLNTIRDKPECTPQEIFELLQHTRYHFENYIAPPYSFVPPVTKHRFIKKPNAQDILRRRIEPPPSKLPEPPHEQIVIDTPIQSLKDLITLTNKYPADTKSNIDLQVLHNIRAELVEIDAMIGLKGFKTCLMDQLLYFMQGLHINREHDYKHMVIYGPPGTGKTQLAKLVGKMYSKMGILDKGVFKKVTRTDLVAGYLGQTAIKTSKVIDECLGGCLFIDEVYSLGTGGGSYREGVEGGGDGGGGDSFSKECIDTLCEALSNHKENLMVIIAGYEKDVNESFFKMNPGLPSRFIWRFTVDEYTPKELMQIMQQKVDYNGWKIDPEIQDKALEAWFTKNKKEFKYFGRDVELLFTYTKICHGRRIFGKPADLRKTITMEDLDAGLKAFLEHASRGGDKKATDKLPESCFGLYL
jgi:ATPase family associated with various cellular activities (AAA)